MKCTDLTKPVDMPTSALEESDLILNPASIAKMRRGFIPHDLDRSDHEVSMAKSDLYQAGKNAAQIFKMIKDLSEEQGLEGWVQEKIIKSADYLNTVREYLEGKQLQEQKMVEAEARTSPMNGRTMPESMDGVSAGTKMFAEKEQADDTTARRSTQSPCPKCGGQAFDDQMVAEEQDACYHKVKSRYKVWPSAYASGALVKCRKVGAKNWGSSKK